MQCGNFSLQGLIIFYFITIFGMFSVLVCIKFPDLFIVRICFGFYLFPMFHPLNRRSIKDKILIINDIYLLSMAHLWAAVVYIHE